MSIFFYLSLESQQHFGAQFHQIIPIKTLHHHSQIWCCLLIRNLSNASISNDDDSLEVPGYNLFRADYPSNTKRGGVCIYYRNFLPLKILGINYLQECINFEKMIGGKLCMFVPLYRLPNQSQDDFESFANNFELKIDAVTTSNPFLLLFLVISISSLIFGLREIRHHMRVLNLML